MKAKPPSKPRLPKGELRVRRVLLLIAAVHAAVGLWMLLAAGSFYDALGPYQAKNTHFIRELAAFPLAMAVMTLVAVHRRQWRIPVLWFTTAQYAFLTAAAVIDIEETHPGWVGYFNVIVEALLTGAFAWFAGYVGGVQTEPLGATPSPEPAPQKTATSGEDFSWEGNPSKESEPPPST